MSNTYNPWLDIASYTFDDSYRFKGREKAIVKFGNIMDNGIMSVLYANSGIGKTSFINAGIEPVLSEQGYFSVHILFSDDVFSQGKTIEKWLINRIVEQTSGWGVWRSTLQWADGQQECAASVLQQCESSLWWFLHTQQFVLNEEYKQKNGLPSRLLLVFDQFEEVFVKSRKVSNGNQFLHHLFQIIEELSNSSLPEIIDKQLVELADRGIFVPVDVKAHYKVIFSLRKEFLSDFDFWTQDRYRISELQQNRMLLLPLTVKQAKRVITEQPRLDGNGKVDTLNSIQDEIIRKLDPHKRDEIEPFLLSVLCCRLYTMAQHNKKNTVTVEDLAVYNIDTIILHFYEDKITSIITNSHHLAYLESALVDKDGSRNRIKTKELHTIHFEKYQAALVQAHLIRKDTFNSDDEYVELIHDRIADAIMKRRQSARKERLRIVKVLATTLLLMVVGILFISMPRARKVEDCITSDGIIRDATTAKCDSVLTLQDVDVERGAFRANPYVKTIRVKDNVTLESNSFAYCPYLTKVIFEGKNIRLCDDVFSHSSLRTVQITESAYFKRVGTIADVPNMTHFVVAPHHEQCEVEVLGKTLLIKDVIWNQHASAFGKYFSEAIYIPIQWKKSLSNISKDIVWCDTITCDQIVRNDYDANNVYYLIDTIQTIPILNEEAHKFLKNNVIYACLPNVTDIERNLFRAAKLQKIDLPNVRHIHSGAFANSDLRDIDAPNVKIVESHAFAAVGNLQPYIQWDSCEIIGYQVFILDTLSTIKLKNLKFAGQGSFQYSGFDTLFLPQQLSTAWWNTPQDTMIVDWNKMLSTASLSPLGFDYAEFDMDSVKDCMCISKRGNVVGLIGKEVHRCLPEHTNILEIGKDVDSVGIYNNEKGYKIEKRTDYEKCNLEIIRVSFRNRNFFAYKNNLYRKNNTSYDCILSANNQPCIIVDHCDVSIGDKVREIVLLDAYSHKYIKCSDDKRRSIILYFPYGTGDYMRQLKQTPVLNNYKDVVEMSWLRTAYYNFTFRFVMNCHYNYGIPIGLITLFILLLYHRLKKLKLSKSKIIYTFVYIFFSLLGLFFIVSSRLLIEKMPTIQFVFVFVYIWCYIASVIAFWIASPQYPVVFIARDVLSAIRNISIFLCVLFLYQLYGGMLNLNIKTWVWLVLLINMVVSIVLRKILDRWLKTQNIELRSLVEKL